MKFNDVINDLVKLESIELQSVRPGAEVTIIEVDPDQSKYVIRNAANKTITRSLKELQIIWEKLISEPAIHVDEVLHGSGSSRNQPETVFANLPYIEWLKIDNKKHLAFVGKQTHPYGTLKKMDSLHADELKTKMFAVTERKNYISLVVTSSINSHTDLFSNYTGGAPRALSKGLYLFELSSGNILFATPEAVHLAEGTYSIIKLTNTYPSLKEIRIANTSFGLLISGNMNYLVQL